MGNTKSLAGGMTMNIYAQLNIISGIHKNNRR